jgi:actin-related protein
LVCEPLAGPAALREALARVLFHWIKAPALLVAPALTTALHTTGADGGLVVDVGYRECHVLAVAHGRPLLHTYQGERLYGWLIRVVFTLKQNRRPV